MLHRQGQGHPDLLCAGERVLDDINGVLAA